MSTVILHSWTDETEPNAMVEVLPDEDPDEEVVIAAHTAVGVRPRRRVTPRSSRLLRPAPPRGLRASLIFAFLTYVGPFAAAWLVGVLSPQSGFWSGLGVALNMLVTFGVALLVFSAIAVGSAIGELIRDGARASLQPWFSLLLVLGGAGSLAVLAAVS